MWKAFPHRMTLLMDITYNYQPTTHLHVQTLVQSGTLNTQKDW